MRDDLPGVIGAEDRLSHRESVGGCQEERYRVDSVVHGDRLGMPGVSI
jgi:hypothetical protein